MAIKMTARVSSIPEVFEVNEIFFSIYPYLIFEGSISPLYKPLILISLGQFIGMNFILLLLKNWTAWIKTFVINE